MCCCALAPVSGRAQERPIHIEPAPLADALADLSRQTGIAIGFEGRLPARRSHRVEGRLTVEQALARLLAGTGLEAQRLSPTAYRLERAGPAAPPRPPARSAPPLPQGSADIIVTGAKREEPLA